MFDPDRIGWHEFWLRAAVVVLSLLVLLLVLMVVVKIVLAVFDLGCWLVGKRQKKGVSEVDEGTARRALLSLIPKRRRWRAVRPLQALLAVRQEAPSGPVYVSEYNGHPSRVHVGAVAAQSACVELLRAEPGTEPHWDWFTDSDGWVMRYVDPDTDEPGPLLGGRVTRTEVEG